MMKESTSTTNHFESHLDFENPEAVRYWHSLEQYFGDPSFIESLKEEFRSTPLRDEIFEGTESENSSSNSIPTPNPQSSMKRIEKKGEKGETAHSARRNFLKLMGASIALATTQCVRRPVQKIVPYNKQPEDVILENPNYYTSVHWDGQESLGLLVKTREGRPLKLEGNPKHPYNKGALNSRAQAHLLSLYDPERLKEPPLAWEVLDKELVAQLEKGNAYWLDSDWPSPSYQALLEDFCKTYKVQTIRWKMLDDQNLREGQQGSYGESLLPEYRLDRAKIIVSIDADFLGTWLHPVKQIKQFSMARKNLAKMSRLYSFDSNYSLTGSNADVRVAIKPSYQLHLALAIAHDLIFQHKLTPIITLNAEIEKTLKEARKWMVKEIGKMEIWDQMILDLSTNSGNCLLLAGGPSTQTEAAIPLQLVINWINSMLGNEGQTVLGHSVWNDSQRSSLPDFRNLIEKMNKGEVRTLLIHQSNPVYSLPKSVGFEEALAKVERVIYIGDFANETSQKAHLVLPENHEMESWGDFETDSGYFTVQQPTIRPLYNTRSVLQNLLQWISLKGESVKNRYSVTTEYDYIRAHVQKEYYQTTKEGFDAFWFELLQEGGFQRKNRDLPKARTLQAATALSNVVTAYEKTSQSQSGVELVITPSSFFREGSLNHSAWLQELPDPVTKIVWDNYISLSLAKAAQNGIAEGDLLSVQISSGSSQIKGQVLTLPAHIQPGLHDEVMAVSMGYGRTVAGSVGSGVGISVTPWIQSSNSAWIFSGHKITFQNTGKKYPLACVQGHHSMEGRKIVAEASLKDYNQNPHANNHRHKVWSLWPGHAYNGHKWAMAVDLSSCVGCNACMTACQAENNVPVVGKNYVLEGREMHWLRIDRYYVGNPSNPESVFQPVMCQQCDNAPCETVCPVLATVHSDEGLNDMVYNRCVGTRYCSNNCPYKVRRFNWFDYYGDIKKPLHLAYNPDVTVRMRGVMEKCNFCLQRIKLAKRKARMEQRGLRDGDIQTACQQSCPSEAITFGDVNNSSSRVAQLFNDARAYGLLEEFNAAPTVRYLTKIRNSKS